MSGDEIAVAVYGIPNGILLKDNKKYLAIGKTQANDKVKLKKVDYYTSDNISFENSSFCYEYSFLNHWNYCHCLVIGLMSL